MLLLAFLGAWAVNLIAAAPLAHAQADGARQAEPSPAAQPEAEKPPGADEPAQAAPAADTPASGEATGAAPPPAAGENAADAQAPHAVEVRVAMLVYADGKTGQCFSESFLHLLAQRTKIRIQQRFSPVDLASPQLYEHPFAVMTGQGPFELSDAQRENLRAYLQRGGLLLASAGCSNAAWAQSFVSELAKVLPDAKLAPLTMDHPIFHTVFDIDRLVAKSPVDEVTIHALEINGRVAVLYTPLGLNDTSNAGGGCCCCGGNEIRDARLINANILAYALTQ